MLPPLPPILSIFAQMSGSFSVPPLLVLTIGAIIVTITLVLSILLFYHWKHYAVDPTEMLGVRYWFLLGVTVFGTGMVLSAIGYWVLSNV